jgi:hypothetical protein
MRIEKEKERKKKERLEMKKTVSDLGAGAYLLMHGYKVVGRRGKDFIFEVTDSEELDFEQKKLEYLSSEFHRFDSYIMSLKKISEYYPK